MREIAILRRRLRQEIDARFTLERTRLELDGEDDRREIARAELDRFVREFHRMSITYKPGVAA